MSPAPVVSARRATADVAVQIVGQLANLAVGVVVTAIIARQLGTRQFGEWSTIFAVTQLCGFLLNLKLAEVAVREAAADPPREGVWIGAFLTLRGTLAVPVALLAAGVTLLIARDAHMRLAGLLLCLPLAMSFLTGFAVVFNLRVRNDRNQLVVTFQSLLWTATVIAVTRGGGMLVALSIGFVAVALAAGVLQAGLALRAAKVVWRGARAHWGTLMRAGGAVGLAGLITLAYGKIDQVIVFELAPHASDAGIYGGIYRILDSGQFIPIAVMTTLFPLAAAAHATDQARLRSIVQNALEYLTMAALPAFAFTLVAGGPALRLLLGSDYVRGAGSLSVLMAAFVIICWGYVAGNMVIVLRLQRRYIVYAVLTLFLNVGLNLALVPRYGYAAAAWVTLASEAFVVGLTMRLVLKQLEMRPRLGRLARAALAAAGLAGVLLAGRALGAGVLVLGVIALVAYTALLGASGALSISEVRRLLASRRS